MCVIFRVSFLTKSVYPLKVCGKFNSMSVNQFSTEEDVWSRGKKAHIQPVICALVCAPELVFALVCVLVCALKLV